MRHTAILTAILIAAFPVSAFAHEEFRLVGVVTKVSQTSLTVRQQDRIEYSIKLDRQTAVTRDGKKLALSDLKLGQTTVVDALGDTMDDLLAIDVRIVPPVK